MSSWAMFLVNTAIISRLSSSQLPFSYPPSKNITEECKEKSFKFLILMALFGPLELRIYHLLCLICGLWAPTIYDKLGSCLIGGL